jgi:3-methyladenine DNA glycosylase/8-oxoguanine DNA glycosylase
VSADGWKSLPPFSWDSENAVLTRVENFSDIGPAILKIYAVGASIIVETDDALPQAEVSGRVSHMLQVDVPMDDFHKYCAASEHLRRIPESKQGRLLRSPTIYEDIVKVIATTNTTWTQTKAMIARIVDNFGTPLLSDPTLRSFPSPEQIAKVSLAEFSEKARMGYRSASVHRIATEIAEGRLDLGSWNDPSLSSDDLYKRFLSLPGVGPYAASCLMIYLGRYDRVNVDSWARTLVGKELGRKVTDKEARDFFEPYGKWKALVYHFYKWTHTA